MSELDTLREWYEFNAHARQGYLQLFARLPPEELSRHRGASYSTLLRKLLHSIGAYCFWLEKSSSGGTDPPPIKPGPDPSLAEVRRFEQETWAQVNRFLDGLTERDLDRTFRVPKGGAITRDHELSVRDMLWHLVEEELHHRGELNPLLWQVDLDPPLFDWIDWVELPQRRRAVRGSDPSRR